MRKANDIERILSDIHDLLVLVANGEETVLSVRFDKDDDLIVETEKDAGRFTWGIGFGEEAEE